MNLDSFLREGLAVNPPLWFQHGLDDITRLAAYWDLHRVILRLYVESGILECFYDSHTGMEALHALQTHSVNVG